MIEPMVQPEQSAGDALSVRADALHDQRSVPAAAGVPTSTVLRQAAIAALLAGDSNQALEWTRALAASVGAPLAKASALVALGVTESTLPKLDAESAGESTLQALQPLAALRGTPGDGLDAAFGAMTNDIALGLLDRPLQELGQPALRTALEASADHSQRFWQRGGEWVNVARARYLRALAANALGQGMQATLHARAGLALLDTHDTEHAEAVDRAFLELELAQGLRFYDIGASADAQDRAHALAARFGDATLKKAFTQRRRRNAALAAHYGRG